ncbi:site-specific DNA-methyltransferase [Clostridium thailandense]|uniref:site-specific DNA-methyltransferase n=1 Tax=Clostridium thailandense TaxID=2794346 RepID=UPI00398980AA
MEKVYTLEKLKNIGNIELTKENLLYIIDKLKLENSYLRKIKKYGLVWEEQIEEAEEILKNNYPVLTEVKEKELCNGNTNITNVLIEGDNLYALNTLLFTHGMKGEKQINIIIDPPYNTGNRDFIYNDNYVNEEDSYRHSKWISFMNKRLRLARELLSSDGAIFISIDDNEQSQLKMLCDDIFGAENFINCISVKTKSAAGASGGGEDKKLKKNIEYLLIYCKNREECNLKSVYKEQLLMNVIKERREEGRQYDYRQVLIDEGTKKYMYTIKDGFSEDIKIYKHEGYVMKNISEVMEEEGLTEDEAYLKYFSKICSSTNSQSSIRKRVIEGTKDDRGLLSIEYVPKTGKNKNRLTTNYYINSRIVIWLSDVAYMKNKKIYKKEKLGTLWDDISWNGISTEGGVAFSSGKKPLKFIKRIVSMCDPSGIFIDFFAGSGTLGQAILEMNNEDHGNRQFILSNLDRETPSSCLNICEGITYNRIKNIITGYMNSHDTLIKGIDGKLKYYKVEFIPKLQSRDTVKIQLADKCTELLCIKENCFNLYKEENDYKIFKNNNLVMVICKNFMDYSIINKIKEELIELHSYKKVLYVLSLNYEISHWEFQELDNMGIKVETIPQKIMEVYEEALKLW